MDFRFVSRTSTSQSASFFGHVTGVIPGLATSTAKIRTQSAIETPSAVAVLSDGSSRYSLGTFCKAGSSESTSQSSVIVFGLAVS